MRSRRLKVARVGPRESANQPAGRQGEGEWSVNDIERLPRGGCARPRRPGLARVTRQTPFGVSAGVDRTVTT